ncbi:hypothetical protein [Streptomyces nodosus]|uniref:Uncharacterized protein n=1 Tax=Streptomyces nodosus TaxID=40318 RepID=A0A0B5DEU5_9ACTN|nr:hypothetical protein [Streptomyces nodosus]AJE41734.1 hypothetical protein SNOD_18175 [Streptomyces nodosus]MBB4792956.1 hypothetical protein [Streptomyces nodosus]QEV40270.1 hypothetical protein CP978_18485 [Streptomyces nodosus]
MSAIGPRTQARLADRTVSVAVGVVGAEPITRAEETAAWHTAGELYVGWLGVRLLVLAVLGLGRSLLTHVAMMLISRVLLVLLMALPAVW